MAPKEKAAAKKDKGAKESKKEKPAKADKGGGDSDSKKSVASDSKSVASAPPTPGTPAGGAPGVPGLGAVPFDFDAGQMFERYDTTRSGFITRDDFQRMCHELGLKPGQPMPGAPAEPSPRTAFDIGRLFERFDTNRSGGLEKGEFEAFFREVVGYMSPTAGGGYGYAPSQPVYGPGPAYPTAAPAGPLDSFTAGQIYERHYPARGPLEKPQFQNLVSDLRQAQQHQHRGYSPVVVPPPLPYAPAPVARPAGPPAAIAPAYVTASSIDLYRRQLGELNGVAASLQMKREQIVQQIMLVQQQTEQVKAARRAIERETMADAEAILHRLRAAESLKLSMLTHDLDELKADVSSIDNFCTNLSSMHTTRPPPPVGLVYSDVNPHTVAHFLGHYPEMCVEADRLAAKPVKLNIDVRADDLPRETAKRLQAISNYEALLELIKQKDQMIWKLHCEKQTAEEDIEELSRVSAAEINQWAKMTDMVTEELNRLRAEQASAVRS